MRTPSLRRRVLGAGLAALLVTILALEAFVALSLREQLHGNLEMVLEARVQVARELAREVEPGEIPERLASLGVPALVTSADGRTQQLLPAVPPYGVGPPGRPSETPGPFISAVVGLPDGGQIEVLATRSGVDATMQRMLTLMAIGTVLALLIGGLLLRRVTAAAIAPLAEIGSAARRTAQGTPGQRLRPDDRTSELGRLAVAYDEMLDSLEAALEHARDEEERTRRFLDDAAHQLRTPISGIRASVEMLLSAPDRAEHDQLMTNLVRETARSSRVLHDLLTMARLDTGRPPTRRSTDLVALCRDEVERTHSLAPQLEVTCDGQEPVTADVEPDAVREALANLLDNARRHARRRIEVTVREVERGWRIRVADDGPGIAPEARTLVFERFATLDGRGGTGLGLPIARSVARAHGGTVTYEDGFVLELAHPADPAEPTAASAALTPPPADPPDA